MGRGLPHRMWSAHIRTCRTAGGRAGSASSRRCGNMAAASSTRAPTNGSASEVQATPILTSSGETWGTGSKPGTTRSFHATAVAAETFMSPTSVTVAVVGNGALLTGASSATRHCPLILRQMVT